MHAHTKCCSPDFTRFNPQSQTGAWRTNWNLPFPNYCCHSAREESFCWWKNNHNICQLKSLPSPAWTIPHTLKKWKRQPWNVYLHCRQHWHTKKNPKILFNWLKKPQLLSCFEHCNFYQFTLPKFKPTGLIIAWGESGFQSFLHLNMLIPTYLSR